MNAYGGGAPLVTPGQEFRFPTTEQCCIRYRVPPEQDGLLQSGSSRRSSPKVIISSMSSPLPKEKEEQDQQQEDIAGIQLYPA